MITLIVLQFSRTYLPALVCSSHRRRPPWKYLVLVLRTMLRSLYLVTFRQKLSSTLRDYIYVKIPSNEMQWQAVRTKCLICDSSNCPRACDSKSDTYDWGRGPRIFSIMARCSLLSWVWNSVNPRYSSKAMQPMLQMSQGWLQPSSKITSGALIRWYKSINITLLSKLICLPVVSGADHLAVMLPVEGGAAEVNEPHLSVLHLPHVLPLQGRRNVIFLSISNQAV